MTESKIKKLKSLRVWDWAYDCYLGGDFIYSADRREQGCVVAEISLTDKDIQRFSPDLDDAEAIIMHHENFLHVSVEDKLKHRKSDMVFKIVKRG
jgi:hypothetical protein